MSISTNKMLRSKPKCLLDDPTLDQSTKCVLKRFLMPSGDVVEIVKINLYIAIWIFLKDFIIDDINLGFA